MLEEDDDNLDWEAWERKPPGLWQRFRWWVKDAYQAVTSVPSFLKRVWDYRKLLWRDRDWDYIFLLEMLQFKIRRMHEHMAHHDILLHGKIYVKQMKYAEFLLDRITKNEYHEDEAKAIEDKYGSIQILSAPVDDMPGCSRIDFTRTKCVTKEDKEAERAATLALHQKQEATRQKDLDRLFRHIRLYLERWWD